MFQVLSSVTCKLQFHECKLIILYIACYLCAYSLKKNVPITLIHLQESKYFTLVIVV